MQMRNADMNLHNYDLHKSIWKLMTQDNNLPESIKALIGNVYWQKESNFSRQP